jgi:hypothetical protein
MDGATGNNQFEILKWLHLNRREGCNANGISEAAKNGHFDIVKWLHSKRNEGCLRYGVDEAFCNGPLSSICIGIAKNYFIVNLTTTTRRNSFKNTCKKSRI